MYQNFVMPISFFVIATIIVLLFMVLAKATYIVSQAEVVLIERFGKFHQLLTSGIHFIVPFIDQPRRTNWTFLKDQPGGRSVYRYIMAVERIDLREAVYD